MRRKTGAHRLKAWSRSAMYQVSDDAPTMTEDMQASTCPKCMRMYSDVDRLVDKLVRITTDLVNARERIGVLVLENEALMEMLSMRRDDIND